MKSPTRKSVLDGHTCSDKNAHCHVSDLSDEVSVENFFLKNKKIKQLLKLMLYTNTGNDVWEKHYKQCDCKIKVDFPKEEILYPNSIKLCE